MITPSVLVLTMVAVPTVSEQPAAVEAMREAVAGLDHISAQVHVQTIREKNGQPAVVHDFVFQWSKSDSKYYYEPLTANAPSDVITVFDGQFLWFRRIGRNDVRLMKKGASFKRVEDYFPSALWSLERAKVWEVHGEEVIDNRKLVHVLGWSLSAKANPWFISVHAWLDPERGHFPVKSEIYGINPDPARPYRRIGEPVPTALLRRHQILGAQKLGTRWVPTQGMTEEFDAEGNKRYSTLYTLNEPSFDVMDEFRLYPSPPGVLVISIKNPELPGSSWAVVVEAQEANIYPAKELFERAEARYHSR